VATYKRQTALAVCQQAVSKNYGKSAKGEEEMKKREIGKWSSIVVATVLISLIALLVASDDGYYAGSGVALSVFGLWQLYRVRCGSKRNEEKTT